MGHWVGDEGAPGCEDFEHKVTEAEDLLGDLADRQKIVTLVSRAASQNGTGQAAVEAEDGEAIPTDDPKAFTQLRLGSIDQNSYAFFMGVMQLYSYPCARIASGRPLPLPRPVAASAPAA